jgi:hypothetical protein
MHNPATGVDLLWWRIFFMKRSLILATLVWMATGVFAFGQQVRKDGWQPIFDGKSLAGWKANEHPENWKIEEGVLVGRGPRSHLFYLADKVKDFELTADVKINRGGNSGIYFHLKYHESGWFFDGHEVQINNSHVDPIRTGSLWGVIKLHESPAKDDTWFKMHIAVQGRNVIVRVDGKIVVDYLEPEGIPGPRRIGEGYIALQQHDPGSVVCFKNVMLKRLSPPRAPGK